jgi:hypothetical protein
MDATPVDSHRRLVLVRRDDVEHLLLIGGPTDVVVEQDIRLLAHMRRPETLPEAATLPRPRPPERPAAAAPQRDGRPAAVQPQPMRPREPAPEPRPQPRPAQVVQARQPVPASAGAAAVPRQVTLVPKAPPIHDPIEDELEKELEVTFEQQAIQRTPQPQVQPPRPTSLDDEMTKLLGELSSHKKIG